MFAKLLKHEWKASVRLLGILSLATLGVGLVATVCLRLLIYFTELADIQEVNVMMVVTPILGMLLLFAVLALVAYGLSSQFLLLHRFYKTKFTDEGYLTFTLPVTNHQILLSGWLNMLIWSLISLVTVLVSVGIIALFGTAEEGLVNRELLAEIPEMTEGLGEMIPIYTALYGRGYAPLSAVNWLVQILTTPLILICCITIGSVAAKKHKILMSIAIYYIYTMLLSMLTSALSGWMLMDAFATQSADRFYIGGIVQLVANLGIAVFGYFFSAYLMKNKLNLP